MYNLLQIILKITMHEKKRQAGSRKEKETACGRLLWYTVAMMRYQNKEENGMVLFVEYPKCTTCRKAKKWLEEKRNQIRGQRYQGTESVSRGTSEMARDQRTFSQTFF